MLIDTDYMLILITCTFLFAKMSGPKIGSVTIFTWKI
jgi:hypothetical protein